MEDKALPTWMMLLAIFLTLFAIFYGMIQGEQQDISMFCNMTSDIFCNKTGYFEKNGTDIFGCIEYQKEICDSNR